MKTKFNCRIVLLLVAVMLISITANSQSLQFNGSNQYVTVPHDLRFRPQNFTFEAWVYVNSSGSFQTILSKGGGNAATNTAYFFSITDDSKIGLYISNGSSSFIGRSTSTVSTSTWHHVAVSYVSNGSVAHFYLDGAPAGTHTYSLTLDGGTETEPLFIGRQGYECQCNYFDGNIDELRIWTSDRTAAQIANSAKFPPELSETDLLAYYDFNQGSGTTLDDIKETLSVPDFDGTLVNSPTWSTMEPDITVLPGTSNYVDFDGTSDYILIDNLRNGGSGAFSAEAWVVQDGIGVRSDIVAFEDVNIEFYISSNGGLVATTPNGTVSFSFQSYIDELTHVAFTADNTSLKLYVNGANVSTQAASGSMPAISGDMYIGMAKNQASQVGFDGRITDLRIWNDVRTTAEIQTNISSVLTGSEAGLVALYTMSEGSGTALNDQSSNNNDGVFYEGQTGATGFGQLSNTNGPRWTSDVNAVFPEFTTYYTLSAPERSTGVVGDINARLGANGSDDAGITYSLSGTDATYFSINTSTGELSTNTNLDFDYPVDADEDNVYELLVTATDGSLNNTKVYGYSALDTDCSVDYKSPANAGSSSGYSHVFLSTFYQSFQPCATGEMGFLRLNAGSVPSTGTLTIFVETSQGPLGLVNVNLGALNWNVLAGSYTTYTIIDLTEYTSQLSSPVILYEGNDYMVGVIGTDALFGFQPNTRPGKLYGASLAENTQYDLIFEMDVIEAQNNAPTFMSASSVDFDENATGTVIDVDARDEYDPNSHTLGTPVDLNITYTLSGADASQFNVDANNGIVTFINQPDFEAPADADGNNVYEITVTADDGLSSQQNITVTVTDGAEPPAFTSAASIALEENHSGTVLDVDAIAFGETAPDIGLTYSISGGNDLDDFEIDNTSGVLTFAAIPDFENPADANTDNTYTITVTASDGTFDTAQEITVEITNGDDLPVFTSGLTVSFVENETGVVYTATATDLESTPTFSLAQGGDNDLFNITSGGELTFKTAPDFETLGDDNSDNQYEIEILATDDANQSTSLMVTVSVTDATEAPTDILLDNAIIGSNNTIGQIVGTLSAQSPDVAAIITFELVSGFGDHSSFVLDGAKLKAAEIFDASVKSTYSIQIRAFDVDNNDFIKELAITVQETIFDANALIVTSGASDGAGSLREAIVAAELNPGKDIINITSGAGTISLTAQLPDITQDLDIIGAGKLTTIIDGGGSVRPFLILTGNVVISDLTIQNGLGKGGDTFGGGAGAGMGGAIYIDNGDVTIERVVFKGNEALGGSSNVGSHDGGDGPLPGLGGAEGETINNFTTGLAGEDGGFGAGGGRGGFGTQGAGGGGNGGYGAGGGGGSTDPFGGEPGGSGGSFAGKGGANGSAGGAGAGLGGAVFIRNGSLYINQASFEDNQALAGTPGSGGGSAQAKGGAVFTMAGTIATAYQTTFSNNIAADAGTSSTDNGDSYGTLEVISELAISTQPTNLSINQGDNATFTAVVSGSGPSYQWQYFDGSEWIDIVDAGAYSGASTDELTITCGNLELDQIEYRVVVSGTINTVTSDPATLTVSTAPALEVAVTGDTGIVCDGTSLTFTAVPSNNNTAPEYQWYVNGQAVLNETNETFTASFNVGDEVYVSLSEPGSCFIRPTVQSDDVTIVTSDLVIMVTNTLGGVSDVNSLAWALNEVNNYTCSVEAVIDLRNLPDNSTITLESLLRIANPSTIIGKGSDLLTITVNTNNTGDGQIFTVNDDGVELTLEGMSIVNTGITRHALYVNVSNTNITLTDVVVDGFAQSGISINGRNAVLTDVISTNNGGAGLEMRLDSDDVDGMLIIDGGSFSNNTTWGVDLSTYSNEKMNFNFENAIFENNQRGLLYNGDADSGVIKNCSFIGHSQFGMEVVANNEIVMDISSSTFAQNGTNTTGPWQGGFYFDGNITASINNCTIANNSFGIIAANATVDLNNSILLGQIRSNTLLDGGTISSSSGHNLGVALGANSDDNVLIADVLNATLTESNGLKFYELVSCTSPAIDAGDDQSSSEFDQLGNSRVGPSDIGAVEFQVGIIAEPQSIEVESTDTQPIMMSVEAVGVSAYQWQVDGGSGFVNIELFDTDYSGADTDMFTINNLSVGIAYRVEVTTTCGTIYSDIAYVLEKAISFTSSASADFNENLTGAVLDIDAKYGIDGNPDEGITYAIVGGADQGLFELDVETGVCSITSELNFENPSDAGLDNTLEVIVQASNGLVSTDQTIIISIQNLDEWIGTATASWSDPSTWESGNVPGPTDDVSIPPSVDIISLDDVRSVRNLTVSSGVMISISDGGALAIFGEYFGEGEVEQTREITGTASGGYSIVGSPMTVTPDVSTLPIVVYEYAGATGFTRKTSGSLDPGRGYFLREAQTDGSALDLSLGGEPNTGDISVSVSTAGDGFNLLANPYTAAISVVDFIDNNPAIDGTLYLWDDGGENSGATRGGDYIAVNRMGVAGVVNNGGFSGNTGSGVFDMNIGSLQGFFAEALTDGNITFSQDMQVTTSASNAVYFRVGDEHEVNLPQTVTLSLSNGELSNMILMGLAPEATMGRDRGYDSDKFSGNDEISFYTRRGDQEYSIEGLGMIEEGEEALFNLEFDLANEGDYTLKLEEQRNLSENMDIILIDKVENREYSLKESTNITFYSEAIQNNDRFAVRFVQHFILSAPQVTSFSLLGTTKGLNISYPSSTEEEVTITNLAGKQVTKQTISFASGKAFLDVSLQPKELYIITIRDQSIKFLITE